MLSFLYKTTTSYDGFDKEGEKLSPVIHFLKEV